MKYRLADSQRIEDATKKVIEQLGKPNYKEYEFEEIHRIYPNIRTEILQAAIEKLIIDGKVEKVVTVWQTVKTEKK